MDTEWKVPSDAKYIHEAAPRKLLDAVDDSYDAAKARIRALRANAPLGDVYMRERLRQRSRAISLDYDNKLFEVEKIVCKKWGEEGYQQRMKQQQPQQQK